MLAWGTTAMGAGGTSKNKPELNGGAEICQNFNSTTCIEACLFWCFLVLLLVVVVVGFLYKLVLSEVL